MVVCVCVCVCVWLKVPTATFPNEGGECYAHDGESPRAQPTRVLARAYGPTDKHAGNLVQCGDSGTMDQTPGLDSPSRTSARGKDRCDTRRDDDEEERELPVHSRFFRSSAGPAGMDCASGPSTE